MFFSMKAPSAPTIVSVEATSPTSISIQWNASKKDGGNPITGYVVEYCSTSNPSFETQAVARDVFSITLDGLTPSTEYKVRVRGENAVGCSVPSATLRTKTDELTPQSDYQNPLPEQLYSGGDGYQPTFIPPQLQQGFVSHSSMLRAGRYQISSPQHSHRQNQPTFMPSQLSQQGFAAPDAGVSQNSGVGGYQPIYAQHKPQKKLLKTLRESIRDSDVDSFHCHLDELERIVQNTDRMKNLLEEGGVLCYGAFIGSNPVVETLIQKGVDINTVSTVPEHPNFCDEVEMSALHWAADKAHVDTVKCLIEKGANLHSKDKLRATPLHWAALRGHAGTAQVLVENGADINVKDVFEETPLHLAAEGGHAVTAQVLVQKGADINVKDADGKTPLHKAAGRGHIDTVEYLIQAEADVNIQNIDGKTPLHKAARGDHIDTVEHLILAGADININDVDGETPLHLAAREGHVGTAQVLVEKGADVNVKDHSGDTPLDLATLEENEEIVTYLKEAADPNILGESEFTGRLQKQRQSSPETDNCPGEKPPANAEKEMESHDNEIDLQVQNLLEKYHHQPIIKHKSLKCLFTGPPRVGKSTLKKRLLKTIKNLLDSGIISPSGGLEKPITVIVGETRECVTVVMQSDMDWKPQYNLIDEAQIVLQFIDKSHRCLPTPRPKPPPPKQVPHTPALATLAPAELASAKAVPSISSQEPGEAESATLDDAKKLIKEVLVSRKLHSIEGIEKTTTLYFMDTGGQPEFHEIMPIILNGPALHLIFFNLTFDLDDPISIQFCKPDGTNSTITYKSSYTGKQMIYQLLSSLYNFSKDVLPDSKPAAVLIGTYLDQLKDLAEQGEKKIDEISDSLNELLHNVEFHSQGFLTYPMEGKMFIPINNYSGNEEEIRQLQAFLKRVVDDRFAPVELPSSWLLFHLVLRHRYENSPGICKLAECRALAKGCGLDEKDVPQVLQYIHQRLGTILFYEEVEGLNELVICDPSVLFNSIYHLVAVSFAGVRAHHTSAAEIRKTGEIPSEELQHLSTQPGSSLLTTKHVVDLLKHFKILTEIVSDDKITYFMPCLLHYDSLELSCKSLKTFCPPPLLVRFDGNYIPIGVFSALVVKLSQSSWEPDRDIRYRNHILFYTDGLFPVELKVHPAYLEFQMRIDSCEEEPEEIHCFCMKVRKKVVDALKWILDLHAHTKKAKVQLGFYCPGSFRADGQPHFCGCLPRQNLINPKAFVCSKSPLCQGQCRLPRECTIWFDYWKDKEFDRDQDRVYNSVGNTSRTPGVVASPATEQHSSTSASATVDKHAMKPTLAQLTTMKTTTGEKIRIIESVAPKWKMLGDLLDFDAEGRTVDLIEANNQLKDPLASCREMFVCWLRGKGRETTWEVLIELLDDIDESELGKRVKTALLLTP